MREDMRAEKYWLNPSGVQFELLDKFNDGDWSADDRRRRRVIAIAAGY
jgi:hypothetical protein